MNIFSPSKPSEYEIVSASIIDAMRRTDRPVVIFGYQGVGKSILSALRAQDVSVTCFCDNSVETPQEIDGIPCYSPARAVQLYPDALFVLCALEQKTCKAMGAQIKQLFGSVTYMTWDVLYYPWIIQKRLVDVTRFSEALFACFGDSDVSGVAKDQSLVIPSLSFRITNRCTLRCRECSFLVPHHTEYSDYPLEDLLTSLREFCRLVDVVLDITLNGGETLLYEDLGKLIAGIQEIPNIISIHVVTNGTVVPSEQILKVMERYDVRLRISDYNLPSNKIDEIITRCNIFNVAYYFYHRQFTWFQIGHRAHNRSDDENRIVEKSCPFNCGADRRILGIFQNSVHVCDRIDGLISAGIEVPEGQMFSLDEGATRESLSCFLDTVEAYKLCDLCNWPMREVEPGIQMDREQGISILP